MSDVLVVLAGFWFALLSGMTKNTFHIKSTTTGMILIMRSHILICCLLIIGLFCHSVFAQTTTKMISPKSIGIVIKKEIIEPKFYEPYFSSETAQSSLILRMTHGPNKGEYVRIKESDLSNNQANFSTLTSYYHNGNKINSELNNSQVTRYDVARFNRSVQAEVISQEEGEAAKFDEINNHTYDFESPINVLEASKPEHPKRLLEAKSQDPINCPTCFEALKHKKSKTKIESEAILHATRQTRSKIQEIVGDDKSISKAKFKSKKIPESCRQIIGQDGKLGPIGRRLYTEMASNWFDKSIKYNYAEQFLKDDALPSVICPNFKNMAYNEKLKAWTWYWMALANRESSCNPDIKHPMFIKKNGVYIRQNPNFGWGLWAAETSPETRRSNKRGPMCSQGNIKKVDTQVSCAIHTMFYTKLKKNKFIFEFNGQYWGPNQNYKTAILPTMRLYKPCW